MKQDKPTVVSYGIACLRKNVVSSNYEVLMIKKKATYSFLDFLRGRYDPNKLYDLKYMFNGMTIGEKALITTRDFATLWMYSLNRIPETSSEKTMFTKSSKKFELLCEKEGENDLISLLSNSSHNELSWEIPKGRPYKNENPLDSAIREFNEETGIKPNEYTLLLDEGTIEYTFADEGICYKYIYYLAIMNHNDDIKFDFTNTHMIVEVSEVKFLPTNIILEFNDKRLFKTIRVIIKKLKRYFNTNKQNASEQCEKDSTAQYV